MKCPLQPLDPITNMGRADCLEAECAWWIKGESRPGGCCVPRLTHYAAALLAGKDDVRNFVRALASEAGADFEAGRAFYRTQHPKGGD